VSQRRSIRGRDHRVGRDLFGRTVDPAGSVGDFLDGLGDLLAVRQLRGLAKAIVQARANDAPVLWALGGHVIKVGLAPILGQLIHSGHVQGLALNGAAAIHDWEIAAIGQTSENVQDGLGDGSFGRVEETGAAFAAACADAHASGRGLGEVLGSQMIDGQLPHLKDSVLGMAAEAGVPVTIHVAIGCDTIHMHPAVDGAALGAATFNDFRRLATTLEGMSGGVWLNCGSAVQLPEVFLKALAEARARGGARPPISTANLDMQRQYRTEQNVLRRPTAAGGDGYQLIGHHELNIPLLAAAIEHTAGS